MKTMRCISFLVLPLSAAGLAACASLLGGDEVKVRPINSMVGLTTEPRDALYESAVTAIDQRDYGRALDYLQADRDRDPKNIKVLNALGVIYDKLGRFDLSARYYAQARAIDPASRIVAANVDYSNRLQGLMSPGGGSVVRMDLPSDLYSKPTGKPTVLASVPEVGAASRSIQNPVTLPRPAQSAVPVPAVPSAEVASKASVAPTFIPPAPPVLHEVKRITVANALPFTKNMPPAAAVPVMAIAPSPVGKPAMVAATSSKVDAIAKPEARMAESAAAKVASPVTVASASLERPLMAAAPRKIDTAKLPVSTGETAAIKTVQPAIVTAPPVVRPMGAPAEIDAVAKPRVQTAELAAARRTSPVMVTAPPPVAKQVVVAAMLVSSTAVQSAKPVLPPRHPLPAVPATAIPRPAQTVLAVLSTKKIFMIGQPVRLINASGKADGVGVVSHRLSALGWTIRAMGAGPTQPVTTLIYNPRNSGAAKAMQRTLPFPVRLLAERGPAGMRLIVGRDYLMWKPKNARAYLLWQKGPAVAGLQKVSLKSVR